MKVRIIIESRTKHSIGTLYDQVADMPTYSVAFAMAKDAAFKYLPQPKGISLRTIIDIVEE